jgi:hypothetical protein
MMLSHVEVDPVSGQRRYVYMDEGGNKIKFLGPQK